MQGALTGGLFRSPSGVLAFVGSAIAAGLADEAIVRQSPSGTWWGQVAATPDRIATLIWTRGGRPFANVHNQWVPVESSGDTASTVARRSSLDVSKWPVIELADLLAVTGLLPGRYEGAAEINVLVPGPLARLVVRRATVLGLRVGVVPASRRSLASAVPTPSDGQMNILLLRLRCEQTCLIPAALVHTLTQLPYLIVGGPTDPEGRSILIDVRCRLPFPSAIIQGMVPEGETWALGPAEAGSWRIVVQGAEVDGSTLMEAPAVQMIEPPALPTAQQIQRIPVQVVERPLMASHVDAVLVDDQELGWLRAFLFRSSMADVSFLLPGPGVWLLTSPGGLTDAMPFGIPLTRAGQSGLFMELGTGFYPPLPDHAYQVTFQLNKETVVVVARKSAFRFHLDHIMPAWALWVGDAPTIQEGLSTQSERLLKGLSIVIEGREALRSIAEEIKSLGSGKADERGRLLEQAQRAELRGDLVRAAELLERAGQPGPAGRLYERAADQADR